MGETFLALLAAILAADAIKLIGSIFLRALIKTFISQHNQEQFKKNMQQDL